MVPVPCSAGPGQHQQGQRVRGRRRVPPDDPGLELGQGCCAALPTPPVQRSNPISSRGLVLPTNLVLPLHIEREKIGERASASRRGSTVGRAGFRFSRNPALPPPPCPQLSIPHLACTACFHARLRDPKIQHEQVFRQPLDSRTPPFPLPVSACAISLSLTPFSDGGDKWGLGRRSCREARDVGLDFPLAPWRSRPASQTSPPFGNVRVHGVMLLLVAIDGCFFPLA
jgi:hypothetical protein